MAALAARIAVEQHTLGLFRHLILAVELHHGVHQRVEPAPGSEIVEAAEDHMEVFVVALV